MRLRLGAIIVLAGVGAASILGWLINGHVVNHWLAVHTGTVNEPGPYYAFWSGFGSDLAEFGLIGAVGTGVYQIVKKYNCHQPGCWRVGNHPAAGGQFYVCYWHHPDFRGKKPSGDLIVRLHRDHQAHQAALNEWVHQINQHLDTAARPGRRDEAEQDPSP